MMDLIERLEKLTAPDRELDRAVALLAIPGAHVREGYPDDLWICVPSMVERDQVQLILPPHYTGSWDAAMGLIAEGHYLMELRQTGPRYWDAVIGWFDGEEIFSESAESEIGPAAVSAAALKARAAMKAAGEKS